jgi:hypothetical protein
MKHTRFDKLVKLENGKVLTTSKEPSSLYGDMSTSISDSSSVFLSSRVIGYSGTGTRMILKDMGSYIRTLPTCNDNRRKAS